MLVPFAGDCQFVWYAFTKGVKHITVVEWSKVALDRMKEKFGGSFPPEVTVFREEFFDWSNSYDGERFDSVFDKDAFGFLSKPRRKRYVEQLCKLLTDNAVVYLEVKETLNEQAKGKGPPYHISKEVVEESWTDFKIEKNLGKQPADYSSLKLNQMAYLLKRQRKEMVIPFDQVDVFGAEPFYGNALAVIFCGKKSLSQSQMQCIARWTNLSETTFIFDDADEDAGYRVRIFTVDEELPFAGHPTLGSFAVWLSKQEGGKPEQKTKFVQQSKIGKVDLLYVPEKQLYCFRGPPFVRKGEVDAETKQAILGGLSGLDKEKDVLEWQWCDNGPGWCVLLVRNIEVLHAIKALPSLKHFLGIAAFFEDRSEYEFEVRALFQAIGNIVEDPVTGSLIAGCSEWLIKSGKTDKKNFSVKQGTVVGRKGKAVVFEGEEGEIWIGGQVTFCVEGNIKI